MPKQQAPSLSNRIALLSILVMVLGAIFILGYWFGFQHSSDNDETKATIFQRAINDAKTPSPRDINNELWSLSESNPHLIWRDVEIDIQAEADIESGTENHSENDSEKYSTNEPRVKVAAWMNDKSFEKNYEPYVDDPEGRYTPSEKPIVWVTLAPQVKTFCQRQIADSEGGTRYNPSFRLKQYLGLNPDYGYDYFVELWVKPSDLFRPCPDPETDDTACNLGIDPVNPPTVPGVEDYSAFFNELVDTQYQPGPYAAPWTRLGYTYDWIRGKRNVGASEFMLAPDAHYIIDGFYTTAEYCTE